MTAPSASATLAAQMTEKPEDAAPEPSPDAATYRSGPPDPLAPAIAAVERGDLVEAKRLATEIARDTSDPDTAELRKRAENLLSQLAPDPLVIAVMIATGVLAVVLYLVYRH